MPWKFVMRLNFIFVVSLSFFQTIIAALSNTSLSPRLPRSLGLGGHGALQLHGQAGVLAV